VLILKSFEESSPAFRRTKLKLGENAFMSNVTSNLGSTESFIRIPKGISKRQIPFPYWVGKLRNELGMLFHIEEDFI
jgi:hypothetical protein